MGSLAGENLLTWESNNGFVVAHMGSLAGEKSLPWESNNGFVVTRMDSMVGGILYLGIPQRFRSCPHGLYSRGKIPNL